MPTPEEDEEILKDVPPEVQQRIMDQYSIIASGPPDKNRQNGPDVAVLKKLLHDKHINLGQCVALKRKAKRLAT